MHYHILCFLLLCTLASCGAQGAVYKQDFNNSSSYRAEDLYKKDEPSSSLELTSYEKFKLSLYSIPLAALAWEYVGVKIYNRYQEYKNEKSFLEKMKDSIRKAQNKNKIKKPSSKAYKKNTLDYFYDYEEENDEDDDFSSAPSFDSSDSSSISFMREGSGSLEKRLLASAKKRMKHGLQTREEREAQIQNTVKVEYISQDIEVPNLQVRQSSVFRKWYSLLSLSERIMLNNKIEELQEQRRRRVRTFAGGELQEIKFACGMRVYFTIEDNVLYLLLGGDKHGQSQDIAKARSMIRNKI